MKEVKKQRVYHPAADIMRIIAGLGVMLIHVTDPFIVYPPYAGVGGSSWWILNLINAFYRVSVPLFIMLSGFLIIDLSRDLNFKSFYKRRLARIGIPTIFWLVFYFIWRKYTGDISTVGDAIYDFLTVNLEHLYFLVIIIQLYFITPLLVVFMKNTDHKTRRVLWISTATFTLMVGLVSFLYPQQAINLHENIVTIFLPYVFYFLAGFFLRKANMSWKHVLSVSILYLYIILFVAIASGGVIQSYYRQYVSIPIMIASIISFVAFLQIDKLSFLSKAPLIRKTIQYCASLIFGTYLVHMLVIELLDMHTTWIPGSIQSPMWVFVLIKTALVIAVSFGIVAIGRKIPYLKYLFA